MVDAQIGTISLPISVAPRINDIAVTVTQIKEIYSTQWINDEETPMSFYLEYEDSTGVKNAIEYDSGLSTDNVIFFNIPSEIYADLDTYSLLFYWQVVNTADPPVVLEQIYTKQAIPLTVRDLHQTQ